MKKVLLIVFTLMLQLPFVLGAHFIVGVVNDAENGESANGKIVVLWNMVNGMSDNLTDIVGQSGNSGTDNIYLLDCELLSTACDIGDQLRAKIINSGDNYTSTEASLFVSGAGFDIMPNLTLNSPPSFINISVDDSFSLQAGEIDLTPVNTTLVSCQGVVHDYDGETDIKNVSGEFFSSINSFYGETDDKNEHYTNDTCSLSLSYGNSNEAFWQCSFGIEYYAGAGNWNCTARVIDNASIEKRATNSTLMNALLALGLPDTIDYGIVNATDVSSEITANVTNYGNVMMNLSLEGYAASPGDDLAMNCTGGNTRNISVNYMKFNLSASNNGELDLAQTENIYTNLSSSTSVKRFNLNYRQNDITNEAINATYWRVYVPTGVSGSCQGNIIFGARQNAGN